MSENNAKPQKKELQIKLTWEDPSDIDTIYANNFFITHAGNEFYLIFGELPVILDFQADSLPEQLSIKPVAKIAITQDNMIRFAEAINKNIKLFEENGPAFKDVQDGNIDN